ncbi:hypothetical protein GJ496_001183 [Pomphorhynchus laevis]|nr:hypothetical protein GJ496_001183 [Pomphorhynchus laevis]
MSCKGVYPSVNLSTDDEDDLITVFNQISIANKPKEREACDSSPLATILSLNKNGEQVKHNNYCATKSPSHLKRLDESSSSDADEKYQRYIKSLTRPKINRKQTSRRSLAQFIVPDNVIEYISPDENDQAKNMVLKRKLKPGIIHFLDQQCNHPTAIEYRKNFQIHAQKISRQLYDQVNDTVFDSRLPKDLTLLWTGRLRTTAGQCLFKGNKVQKIELATKICDDPVKLRDTLIHEMCHVAVAEIDNDTNGGHGRFWRKWTLKAMKKYPFINPIKRCHNYEVFKMSIYDCTQCGHSVKRCAKSLEAIHCERCAGTMGVNRNNSDRVGNSLNKFAAYVKSNYKHVREAGMSHGQAMRTLSKRYGNQKILDQ